MGLTPAEFSSVSCAVGPENTYNDIGQSGEQDAIVEMKSGVDDGPLLQVSRVEIGAVHAILGVQIGENRVTVGDIDAVVVQDGDFLQGVHLKLIK